MRNLCVEQESRNRFGGVGGLFIYFCESLSELKNVQIWSGVCVVIGDDFLSHKDVMQFLPEQLIHKVFYL